MSIHDIAEALQKYGYDFVFIYSLCQFCLNEYHSHVFAIWRTHMQHRNYIAQSLITCGHWPNIWSTVLVLRHHRGIARTMAIDFSMYSNNVLYAYSMLLIQRLRCNCNMQIHCSSSDLFYYNREETQNLWNVM